jgi:hypothetical protein
MHKFVQIIWYKFLYRVKLHKSEVLFLWLVIINLELRKLVFIDFGAN